MCRKETLNNYDTIYIRREDKMQDEKKFKNVTFHCPIDVVERLDRLAEKGDIPRSKLILNMVETTLTFLETTQKVGILQLSILLRDAGDKLKDLGKKWSEKKSFNDLAESEEKE